METEANGSSTSTEAGIESTASDPAIWEQIERSESYLVCSMYEEAASLASSILKCPSQHSQHLEAGDRFEFYDMSESAEKFADNTKRSDEHFVPGVDKYLKVVEVYVLKLLGTILNDVELATSWIETAELPEETAINSSQGSLSSSPVDNYDVKQTTVPDGYPKARDGETVKKQTVFNLSKKLEPCVWWFRTATLKFGSAPVVISNGKIVLGFLILLIYYVLRRKQTLKRIMQRQALTMKKALVDLWQLAFSYQVNPLAAVQPLAAATRGGR